MRTYCFTAPNLVNSSEVSTYDVSFPAGEAPEYILVGGFRFDRDRQAEIATQSVSVKNGNGHVKRAWPMPPCVGSGVHADDGPKLAKFLKDRGCPTQVVDGDPIYTSAAHQKKALKLRGLINKS